MDEFLLNPENITHCNLKSKINQTVKQKLKNLEPNISITLKTQEGEFFKSFFYSVEVMQIWKCLQCYKPSKDTLKFLKSELKTWQKRSKKTIDDFPVVSK